MNRKIEPISRIKKLEQKYENETRLWLISLALVLLLLIFFGFAQFAILDYYFKTTFNIPDRAKVLGIPSNNLLSFIATATLPITVLIDESEILSDRLKLIIPVFRRKISPMWVVFVADLFLTSLAFFGTNQSRNFNFSVILFTSFTIGASFSTFILYLTKGMTAVGKKASTSWHNFQVVRVYAIDPVPYGDDEKVRLSTEAEIAREETRDIRQKLDADRLIYDREIQRLKEKIAVYENHLGALAQLKEKFNQIREIFQELTPKSQDFFDKFTKIEESVSDFILPKFEVSRNGENQEKNNYTSSIVEASPESAVDATIPKDLNQNAVDLEVRSAWNLTLPSEVSPIVINLLKAMEIQNFPPPQVGRYTPKNNLASCSVLQFEDYGVLVYCRDENYMRGEKWDSSDELKFKCKLIQQNMKGYINLHFTETELLGDSLGVLEQIKSAIALRRYRNFERL